jgi:hypothetical protein
MCVCKDSSLANMRSTKAPKHQSEREIEIEICRCHFTHTRHILEHDVELLCAVEEIVPDPGGDLWAEKTGSAGVSGPSHDASGTASRAAWRRGRRGGGGGMVEGDGHVRFLGW